MSRFFPTRESRFIPTMGKLKPAGKTAAVVAALASADGPLTLAELQAAVGPFPKSTLWRLSGVAWHSCWYRHPLVQRAKRGQYEVTNMGRAALRKAGVRLV
jgi:hypothetical protein